MIDPGAYKTLTFDCYGTLIDWETGILRCLQPMLQNYYVNTIDEFVLNLFATLEPEAQQQGGTYKDVLTQVTAGFARRLGFTPDGEALGKLAASVAHWPAFPDTVAALATLRQHFKLGIVSNIDDDLFAASQAHLEMDFDFVVTAEQVGAYKPDPAMFKTALAKAEGPVLHVAQSRYHDIVPATELKLDTVWINRPSLGAAHPVDAKPTWEFASMAEFAAAIGNS